MSRSDTLLSGSIMALIAMALVFDEPAPASDAGTPDSPDQGEPIAADPKRDGDAD